MLGRCHAGKIPLGTLPWNPLLHRGAFWRAESAGSQTNAARRWAANHSSIECVWGDVKADLQGDRECNVSVAEYTPATGSIREQRWVLLYHRNKSRQNFEGGMKMYTYRFLYSQGLKQDNAVGDFDVWKGLSKREKFQEVLRFKYYEKPRKTFLRSCEVRHKWPKWTPRLRNSQRRKLD